LAASAKTEE
jgi:hypothetical protein